jgi:hypothetical protein
MGMQYENTTDRTCEVGLCMYDKNERAKKDGLMWRLYFIDETGEYSTDVDIKDSWNLSSTCGRGVASGFFVGVCSTWRLYSHLLIRITFDWI